MAGVHTALVWPTLSLEPVPCAGYCAWDNSENKIDGLCPEGVCCLAAETFIQKVFIEHLYSEPGIQQCCTKPTITGIDRSLPVVIAAKMGKAVQVL